MKLLSRIIPLLSRRVRAGPAVLFGLVAGWALAHNPSHVLSEVARQDVLQVRGEHPAVAEHVSAEVMPPPPASANQNQRAPVASRPSDMSPREVAKNALSSTVFIRGGGVYGAGVAIGERYILTCLHVVADMETIEVSLAESPPQRARIADRDKTLDLAVLELETSGLQYAELASGVSVQMGDPVFAMGAPRKMTFSLGRGIVSYVGRSYDGVYFLQTDIATNSGSSGGPVLDDRGRVIAISSFILRHSHGLAFALPIDYAYRRFGKFFASKMETLPFEDWLVERTRRAQPALVAAGDPAFSAPPAEGRAD